MSKFIEKTIANTFMEIAQGLETGSFGKRPKVALTGMGSEHGEENAMKAALMAAKEGIDVYYIGQQGSGRCCHHALSVPHRCFHRGPGGDPW